MKKSWLSSHMAPFMVLLNGLILTGTVFFALSVFINEMHRDVLNKNSEALFSILQQDLKNLEQSFEVSTSVLSEGRSANIELFKKASSDLPALMNIVIANVSNKQLIFQAKTDFFINSIIEETLSSEAMPPSGSAIALAGNGQRPDLIMFNRLVSAQKNQYQIMGFVSLKNRIRDISIQQGIPIMSAHIMQEDKMFAAYSFEEGVSSHRYQSANSNVRRSLTMGENNLDVEVDFITDARAAFLAKIPFLMLAFGLTLTFIGALYVRNNQQQSIKMADMNHALAIKNAELNGEVLNREKLNISIRKAEKENRAILNAVSDIIFEIDQHGTIVFLNAAWHRITGFDRKAFIGQPLVESLHPHDVEAETEKLLALINNNGEPYTSYTKLQIHNGTYRSIELRISMTRRDDNAELRVVGTITDTEERHRAERALGEAEKKYRTIVENAAGGIFQLTPEGSFISANPALSKILGFENVEQLLREIRNSSADIYINQKARELYIQSVSSSNDPVYQEAQIKCADGSIIWIGENMRAVKNDEGRVLFFEGSIEDISLRKKTEEALKEAKIKSDLANRAKSEFLANMSHELRTPLNSIIGFSEIIKNQIFGPIGQDAYQDYAQDIHESGKKLLEVINNILDVSRIEVGDRQLNESLVDMKKIIPVCLGLMAPKFEARGIRIAYDENQTCPHLVGEELGIKQMIMNLLSNAIKYSQDGGVVTLVCHVDDVSGDLKISVTDTGIGMSEDELSEALMPFNKIHQFEAGWNGSGTGLGLTLVDSLVKMHGGQLEIVSKKGVGTKATLVFPTKRISKKESVSKKPLDKLSVLIPEDDKDKNSDGKPLRTIH